MYQDDKTKAIADFNEVIRRIPTYSGAYTNRALAWSFKGDKERAIADYTEAIRLDPKVVYAHNGLAWLWATSADGEFRDGTKAVASATQACELTMWKDWNSLSTLAAAFAETGDFKSAVKWAEKSLELAPESRKKTAQEHLDLYQSGKPFREGK